VVVEVVYCVDASVFVDEPMAPRATTRLKGIREDPSLSFPLTGKLDVKGVTYPWVSRLVSGVPK